MPSTLINSASRLEPEAEPAAAEPLRNASPEDSGQWIVLAQLLRPQGRKGEILAELLTDFPQRFETHRRVFLAAPGYNGGESQSDLRLAEVAGFWLPVGKNEGRIVLHFAGIDCINAAEDLAGLDVIVPASERLPLDEDAAYVSDLIGCIVYDHAASSEGAEGDGAPIGSVTEVQFATTPDGGRRIEEAAPLLCVETEEGEEILIPFAKFFLKSVDTAAKRIDMLLPPGLIEVNRP